MFVTMIPVGGSEGEIKAAELVAEFLSGQLDYRIGASTAASYGQISQFLIEGIAQIAYLGPKSFVTTSDSVPLEALVVEVGPSGQPGFIPMLVALKSSGLSSIDGALDGSKVIAFTDEQATAGYLVPAKFFGEKLNSSFSSIEMSGSHAASLVGLKEGKYDVIATDDIGLTRFAAEAGLTEDDVVILKKFDLAPGSTFAVPASLPEDLKDALRGALIQMGQDQAILSAMGINGLAPTAADGKAYFDFISNL
ncbi:MAG: phosphate/phosphite/phosphonate ABC transporter substrate-binding protein [Puniceicoccaceae bacterium]